MNKEEQIDALEAQVKQQHPSWNNDDIRNQAVRMFYMDTTTVLAIIKMIDNRLSQTSSQYENLLYEFQGEETTKSLRHHFAGKIEAYEELHHHLQEYIELQVSAMENSTGE